MPANLDEFYDEQVDAVHEHLKDIPVFHECLRLICDALDTQRILRMRDLVRGEAIQTDPYSYDKGFERSIRFIRELIERK